MRYCQTIRSNKKTQISWVAIIFSFVLLGVFACGSTIQQNDGVSKASLRSTEVIMKARGDNANAILGTKLFMKIRIHSEEAQLDLKVSDEWRATPDNTRDKLVDEWLEAWMTIAGDAGWTGLARVQIIDMAGERVAFKSGPISVADSLVERTRE